MNYSLRVYRKKKYDNAKEKKKAKAGREREREIQERGK